MIKKTMLIGLLAFMLNQTVQAARQPDFSIRFPVEVTCTVDIPWLQGFLKAAGNAMWGSAIGSGLGLAAGFAGCWYLQKKKNRNMPILIPLLTGIGIVAGFKIGLKK